MLRHFVRVKRPTRIKSIKELDPSFKPRWHKLEVRLVQAMLLLVMLFFVGALLERAWLASIGFFGLAVSFVGVAVLNWGANVLAAAGYWFPPLALTAARMDVWLERDLDWSR
jgi:hypothetical protein